MTSLRWIAASAAMLAVFAGADLFLVLLAAIVLLTIDIKQPITLKNFFLAYVALVFGVGGGVLRLSSDPYLKDIFGYTVAFLIGYWMFSLKPWTGRLTSEAGTRPPREERININAVRGAITVVVCLSVLFLAYQISGYGIGGYYRGQALRDQFLNYGKADRVAGIEQLVRFSLTYTAAALVVLYVYGCTAARAKILYRYPVMALVIVPALSLRRYDAIVGSLTLLAILSYERSVQRARTGLNRAERKEARQAQAEKAGDQSFNFRTGIRVALGLVFVLALGTALFIGNLRRSFSTSTDHITFTAIATSELTPVAAYTDIRSNIYRLGRPNGKTILPPLLLKVVPRAWFPGKPMNSGAYVMSIVRSEEFAAGYAIPPTYFGDVYLNFGMAGALFLCWALGGICARLDKAYRQGRLARMPVFLIVFGAFLPIMRNPLSESLFQLLSTLALFAVFRIVWRAKEQPEPAPNEEMESSLVSGLRPA